MARGLRWLVVLCCTLVALGLLCVAVLPGAWWQQLGSHYFASGTAKHLVDQAFAPARAVERGLLCLVAFCCWALLAFAAARSPLYSRLIPAWQGFIQQNKRIWPRLSLGALAPEGLALIGFLAFVAGIRGWFILTTPITYDEAYSYLNFSQQGPLVSLLYYPGTNNHPLFNALNALVPGIRLLPWLLGLVGLLLAWRWLRSRVGVLATFVVLVLLAFAYPMQLYGIHARGYSLMVLCTLVGVFLWERVARQGWRSGSHTAFLLLQAVALWALPTQVLVIAGFYVAWLWQVSRRQLSLRGWLVSGTLMGVLGCAYYLPLMALNGVATLSQTGTLQDMQQAFSLASYWHMVQDTLHWSWRIDMWALPLYAALMGYLAWRAVLRKDALASLLLVQGLLWLLLVPATGVLQFARSFTYLVPIVGIALAVLLVHLPRRIRQVGVAVAGLCLLLYSYVQVMQFAHTLEVEYAEAYAAQHILYTYDGSNGPVMQVFASDAFYHNLKLARYPGLEQPQQSWEAVATTQAEYILAHATGDSLAWIPPHYTKVDSLPAMYIYRRQPHEKSP